MNSLSTNKSSTTNPPRIDKSINPALNKYNEFKCQIVSNLAIRLLCVLYPI